MNFDQDTEGAVPPSPIGPPEGSISGARFILWNEREFRAGWRLLVFLLFYFAFTRAGVFLIITLHLPQFTSSGFTATSTVVGEMARIIAAFAATAIMGKFEARPFAGYGLPSSGAFGAGFQKGAAWGIAMIAGTMFLIRAFGGFSFGELALRGPALWGYAAFWGLAFICVAISEEFLFRGYAQFTLAMGIGFWPAATVLSAAFGAIHLGNSGEDKVGALSVFVIAMFFCLTLRRTGNLWFAVGLHAAFDWGETFLFSVPDSGLVAPGHLLNSSLHGAAWITGGAVGPEGSVMAFAVIGIATVIFTFVYPSKT